MMSKKHVFVRDEWKAKPETNALSEMAKQQREKIKRIKEKARRNKEVIRWIKKKRRQEISNFRIRAIQRL